MATRDGNWRASVIWFRRFMRRRPRGLWPVWLCALVVGMSFAIGMASQPSARQTAQATLAGHQHQLGFGALGVPPGDEQRISIIRSAASKVDSTAQVSVIAFSIPLAQGSWSDGGYYIEDDWESGIRHRQAVLAEGRWPKNPGEVAVSRVDGFTPALGSRLPAPTGIEMRVVGILTDRGHHGYPLIAAGRGTWASFSPQITKNLPGVAADAVVMFDGEPDAMVRALTAVSSRATQRVSSRACFLRTNSSTAPSIGGREAPLDMRCPKRSFP